MKLIFLYNFIFIFSKKELQFESFNPNLNTFELKISFQVFTKSCSKNVVQSDSIRFNIMQNDPLIIMWNLTK